MEHYTKSTTIHNNNDVVYYEGTIINVPFSWEYKPGLSKVTTHHHATKHANATTTKLVLQPPPCSLYGITGSSRSDHNTQNIPLGLCAFQSTLLRINSSFRMESTHHHHKVEEDPFVEAYKKCTKSPFIDNLQQRPSSKGDEYQKNNNGSWPSIRKYMHILSCKYSGDDVIGRKAVHTYKM